MHKLGNLSAQTFHTRFLFFACCWWLRLGISQVARPLQASSSAFRMARHGQMISIQHFELMPHGRPWYLPTQTIDRFQLLCFLFGGGTSHTPRDPEVYFKHSDQAMRMDRARGGSASSADIHRHLKVCERQTMEHLLARGHRSFLPAQGFWSEYKTCFLLFCRNGPF